MEPRKIIRIGAMNISIIYQLKLAKNTKNDKKLIKDLMI